MYNDKFAPELYYFDGDEIKSQTFIQLRKKNLFGGYLVPVMTGHEYLFTVRQFKGQNLILEEQIVVHAAPTPVSEFELNEAIMVK